MTTMTTAIKKYKTGISRYGLFDKYLDKFAMNLKMKLKSSKLSSNSLPTHEQR